MAGQGPFPLAGSGDVEMSGGGGTAAGAGHPAGGVMAELEEALGMAAAWFNGDASAAAWAADAGADLPGSPTGVLPADDGFDALQQEGERWGGWREDDAQDALLALPAFGSDEQGSHALGLGLPVTEDLLVVGGGSSNPEEGAAGVPDPALPQPAVGAGAAAGGAGAAQQARQATAELRQLQLDDIDAEPGDTVAPGGQSVHSVLQGWRGVPTTCAAATCMTAPASLAAPPEPWPSVGTDSPLPCPAAAGPLSLEAAVTQGSAAGAGAPSEPAPPPIEPAPTDLGAAEEDPLAALEAAVEADKPKWAGRWGRGSVGAWEILTCCGVCGCSLQAQVYCPATAQPLVPLRNPSSCSWQSRHVPPPILPTTLHLPFARQQVPPLFLSGSA